MKLTRTLLRDLMTLPALALALCVSSQATLAQSDSQSAPGTKTQSMQPDPQQNDQNSQTAATQKTFSGKIMKSGDKLVLTASGTTYQLDDQQKAQDFLNKDVKVTGSLDPSTGTIRVSAIDPA